MEERFVQEIRWSSGAGWALGGLFLFTLVSVLAPAVGLPMPARERLFLIGVALAVVVLFGAVWWVFSTLRLAIDGEALTVGFGPFRERLPLVRIVACGGLTYRWWEWGGWGIRCGWRARLYNVPGDAGRAVQLNLEDGSRLLFSSPDLAAVCRALRERRPEIWEIPASATP